MAGQRTQRKRSQTVLVRRAIAAIRERDFQQTVIDLARLRGFLVYHPFDSRRSEPGFPDLTIVGKGRCLFVELKTEGGRLRKEQRVWRDALEATEGVEYFLWRPSDWEEVVRVLG